MEEIKVVGLKHVDFVNREGERVNGTSVFFTQAEDHVEGEAAGKLWVPAEKWDGLKVRPKVGGQYVVYFNKKGKVQTFADVK